MRAKIFLLSWCFSYPSWCGCELNVPENNIAHLIFYLVIFVFLFAEVVYKRLGNWGEGFQGESVNTSSRTGEIVKLEANKVSIINPTLPLWY